MNENEEIKTCSEVEKPKKSKIILDFIIKTMNGMAYGLFGTLIIGTILNTIGGFFPEGNIFNLVGEGYLFKITGVGIALGIGLSLNFTGLKLIGLASVGGIATFLATPYGFKIGDPLTVYVVCILVALAMQLVLRKKTLIDIIIIPLFAIAVGVILTLLLSTPIAFITKIIGKYIGIATEYQPFIMGIVIAVIMGMALTAPISSAAIAATIFTPAAFASNANVALAGGAALVGCCAQMVGFAVMSIRDNKIGTVFAVGIGTSMLQFKNILKKPIIWLPTIIASAILGPISTCVLKVGCLGTSAGMGTSGLVGQIGTIATMGTTPQAFIAIFVLQILAPAVIVFFIDLLFYKLGLIKKGDLTI